MMLAFLCIASCAGLLMLILPTVQHIVFVGGGYSSKVMCTGLFLSNRSYSSIFDNELAVGHSNLFIVPTVNWEEQTVTSSVFGLSSSISAALRLSVRKAVYLGPRYGCQLELDGIKSQAPTWDKQNTLSRNNVFSVATPTGVSDNGIDVQCVRDFISQDFGKEAAESNQTRAIAVSYKGAVIAEGYQEGMGITSDTPLLGWSMTKSVFSMVVGAAIQHGLVALDTPLQLKYLNHSERAFLEEINAGKALTFRDLLIMNDVLRMEEDYSITREVVTMLYGSFDMSQFTPLVSTRERAQPPSAPARGTHNNDTSVSAFAWYYSSAVSNLLSLELRSRFPSDEAYWAFPHNALFDVVGASSFSMELDPSGSFVASSFSYATARDWTRLGELLLARGVWEGKQVLPAWFVEFMQTPNPASGGHYGGHIWLNAARVGVEEYNRLPLSHPRKRQCQWMTRALPPDAYYMSGHDGQFVFIVPSRELVVTRLGFTHDEGGPVGYRGWNTESFFSTIINSCVQRAE